MDRQIVALLKGNTTR